MYRITELGRLFGLSRSTLLYYDRIGLLKPTGRSQANYRRYSEPDRARLQAICLYRQRGLAIGDIQSLLARPDATTEILQRRLLSLEEEIHALQAKQQLLAEMLQVKARGWIPIARGKSVDLDKATWVAILRAAGMSDAAMDAWHREFEQRAPQAHHAFLLALGISEEESLAIREHACA
jgi:DNA-binding transcriptional MerR regulator